MSIRVRYLVAGLVTIAVGVVLVLVLRGGDAEKGETVLGKPGRGFPLRGSLAADDEAIAGAVSAWRERAEEDEDEDEADDATDDLRPDEDEDVLVLWAGRVGDRDVVMLEGGEAIVAMQRGGGRDWYTSGESPRDSDRTTGMPVGTSNFVVVPTGDGWRSVNASDSSGLAEVGDGLFSASSSEQEGFVLPESGAGSGDDQVSIYVAGVGGRLMSREAFAGLEDALAAGYARVLWIAMDEAQRNVNNEVKRLPTVPRELRTPPPLEVVWTGRLPDQPQAAIIAQGRGSAQTLALGYAAPPDEEDSDGDFIPGAQLLGFGDPGRSRFDASETAVGGDYVDLDGVPYLVLAGTGVETLHALVGDREISRRAPAAVIDARPFAQLSDLPDTVIYGRTADGDVIAPLSRR